MVSVIDRENHDKSNGEYSRAVICMSAIDRMNDKKVFMEYQFKRSTVPAQQKRSAKAQQHSTQNVVLVAGLSLVRANQIIDTVAQHVSFGKKQEFIDYIKRNCNQGMEDPDADMVESDNE